jgi:2-dehydro-3-deoxyglucarate aldolase/4-hydroxy-2-oxoheptanedioate aldolase
MNHQSGFIQKMRSGKVSVGTAITFSDPTVTEALCTLLDFVWIDAEHNPLSLAAIQAHVMATKGTAVTPLVRVPWNDPVLIKPILDLGAAGIIVPFVRTADDVRLAVSACKYPPDGIRGFGPRRPSDYGRIGGPTFCQQANENVITIVQIEHIDAVKNIEQIVAVQGLTAIVLGLNDLSGTMGCMGEPRRPEVLQAAEKVIAAGRKAGVFVGVSMGDNAEQLIEWADKGAQWLAIGADFLHLVRGTEMVANRIREHLEQKARLAAS